MQTFDLRESSVRALNEKLHSLPPGTNETWRVENSMGAHALAVGLEVPVTVEIDGHAGYYCGGMNKEASIVVQGNVGTGFGENIMSGEVRCEGNASASAGATGHGGLVIVKGNASSRCGISMKGVDIVVGGNVGHMSAFMAQAGRLVVCGDAGADLGDSIYEAVIYVRGNVESCGSDCVEKEMTDDHVEAVRTLLSRAGLDGDPSKFRRYGSARKLYNFDIDHAASY